MDPRFRLVSSLLALAGFLLTIARTKWDARVSQRSDDRFLHLIRELWEKNGPQCLGIAGAAIVFTGAAKRFLMGLLVGDFS